MDPRTASTFFGELEQQNGGMIPFVSPSGPPSSTGRLRSRPAIGPENVAKYVTAIAPEMGGSKQALPPSRRR